MAKKQMFDIYSEAANLESLVSFSTVSIPLYSLPNIVRVVKSRRMRWTGHVARMGGGERCARGSGGEV
jgi:hypothetical protein